ncbi:MAG: serine/threonine-protein kinase [Victivallales bacterium]|jgi:histidine kinase
MNSSAGTSFFFAGERIADFQLIRPLRIRELSECWYAARLNTGAPVAVKFLRKKNPGISRFYDIAEFLQKQESPFLIHVFEYAETNTGMPYAVMEYAACGSLRRWLGKHGPLPLAGAVYLLRGMLQALAVLHSHGIVHRDIKPDNIWLMSDGGIRLGDLGLAKLPDCEEEPGKVFGTASYMSPEQALDSTRVDSRSDLYSLALVLTEALTGKRCRSPNNFAETVKNILADRSVPPIAHLREAATEKLAVLLNRMREYNPALRPRSAAAILDELETMALPENGTFFKEILSV